MNDFEELVRRTMREHDAEAPTAAGFRAAAERPVMHRRGVWLSAVATAACVLGLVGVLVVTGRTGGHSGTAGTNRASTTSLQCPQSHPANQRTVPDQPSVPNAGERLAPTQAPTTATVCAYLGGSSLSGVKELTGGLQDLADTLAWAPRELSHASRPCTMDLRKTDGDSYLVALVYADGIEWVAAPGNHCAGASNGMFSTLTNYGRQAAAAYHSGRWTAEVPSAGCAAAGGRYGDEAALVPVGATSLRICSDDGKVRLTLSPPDFDSLVSALDGLPTAPADGSCQTRSSSDASKYSLRFGYDVGPAVVVHVMADCTPSIFGFTLEASDPGPVISMIENFLLHK